MGDSMPVPEELSITDVLRYYGATSIPTGTGWKAMKCPFHDDGIKSASINVDRNVFNCHACPYKGEPLWLIMRKERIGEEEAIEFAGSVLGKSSTGISPATTSPKKLRPLGRNRWKGILE